MRVTVIATGFDADKTDAKVVSRPVMDKLESSENAASSDTAAGIADKTVAGDEIEDALNLFKKRGSSPSRLNF